MQEKSGDEKEIISMLESAAKQGNYRAYYILGNMFQDKLEFTKAQ